MKSRNTWVESVWSRQRWWRWPLVFVALTALTLSWYSGGLVSAKVNSASASDWVFEYEQTSTGTETPSEGPEAYLKKIQALISSQDHEGALQVSSALTERFPNFQLGQWVHGELLNVTSPSPVPWPPEQASEHLRTRKDLLKELQVRLQSWRQPYVAGTVPRGLGYVDPSTKYLAAVDATTSRFYLFRNESTHEHLRLSLIFDAYVTVGLNGLNKRYEGDKRSPIGVYFTQQLLPGKRLPDLYGSGALTLDYPNAWDSAQGRTGSGIWIHGTPSTQYSRPPEASDGCIVVSNDAMLRLLSLDHPRGIPVLIQEKIHWVPAQQAQASGRALLTALTQAADSATVPVNWSADDTPASGARMVHLFSWTDEGQEIALTEVHNGKRSAARQFWIKREGKGWVRFNGMSTDLQSL